MELFIFQTGQASDSNTIRKCWEGKYLISDPYRLHLIKRYALPFWMHLAQTLHSLNQKVVNPLTLWLLLQEYRGLSRIGRILSNYVGLAPSLRTYDKIKRDLLRSAEEDVRRIINSGYCLVAADNYTHSYRSAKLSPTQTTQYHQPNYT